MIIISCYCEYSNAYSYIEGKRLYLDDEVRVRNDADWVNRLEPSSYYPCSRPRLCIADECLKEIVKLIAKRINYSSNFFRETRKLIARRATLSNNSGEIYNLLKKTLGWSLLNITAITRVEG